MQPLQLNWYILFTRQRQEKKIAKLLQKKGHVAYCPMQSDRKRMAADQSLNGRPVFPNYLFVRALPEQLPGIKNIPGAISFLHWMEKPVRVADPEMDVIRNFLQDHHTVHLEKIPFELNTPTKMLRAAYFQKDKSMLEVRADNVRIEIPSLGLALIPGSYDSLHSLPEITGRTATA